MQGLRLRELALRHGPRVLGAGGAALALVLGWTTAAYLFGPGLPQAPAPPTPAAPAQTAEAEAPPQPMTVPVRVQPGETFAAAVERTGVPRAEAERAVGALAGAMDTRHVKAGLAFQAAVAPPTADGQPAQLVSLSLQAGPTRALTLSRSFDGALKLKEMDQAIRDDTVVANGKIDGSLYESAERVGATSMITAQVVRLFARKLDFERDIQPGDDFRLVFDRKVTESGETVSTGELQYAELHGVKFYRFARPRGEAEYFDQFGQNIKGFLLRTPVYGGARITSLFGMREHPILGYTRAHQGIDFGASVGTPILAAGDGMVVEAGPKGGYGNWLRIRHTGVWDTGYGHISRFAAGIRPGVRVRQGEVVAYVGATGLATGPHLHYEIWERGQRVNPLSARVPQGVVLAGRDLKRFKAEKAHIDALLDEARPRALAMADTAAPLRR